MTKPIDDATAREFNELRSFLYAFMDLAEGCSQAELSQLTAQLDEMQRRAPKRALASLRMAVNDCMEMSSHWAVDKIKSMDIALNGASALTLSEVRRRFSKKVSTILDRDRIRSEVEYYIVAGLLADLSSNVSDDERSRLEAMAARYEGSRLSSAASKPNSQPLPHLRLGPMLGLQLSQELIRREGLAAVTFTAQSSKSAVRSPSMESVRSFLPAELWDFLLQGRQLDYDAEATELGSLTLHAATSLRLGRVYAAPSLDDDPNRESSGVYRIPAISLVGACERYDADHLLTYLPLEQSFAAFDGDHARVTLFPGASWREIVKAPARYLNALWQPQPEVAVAREVAWWKRYVFFEDAFE